MQQARPPSIPLAVRVAVLYQQEHDVAVAEPRRKLERVPRHAQLTLTLERRDKREDEEKGGDVRGCVRRACAGEEAGAGGARTTADNTVLVVSLCSLPLKARDGSNCV